MKNPEGMTDIELLDAYKKGIKWVSEESQVTGKNRNEKGETYNHLRFMNGLNRLQNIEKEMSKRNILY